MAVADTYDDFYIATVYGYDLTTRELDVFIPKLMPNIAEGLEPRELPTNFGNQTITIPYKETIKRASTIKVRAKNVNEPLPDIGSKVMVKFLNGNIHISYWEPFNMNADYQVVSEEMYPKYYTLQIGSKTINVNKDDVIMINLPDGFTVSKIQTVDPKVQLLSVNMETQQSSTNNDANTTILTELVNENQTIKSSIENIFSDINNINNKSIDMSDVANGRLLVKVSDNKVAEKAYTQYTNSDTIVYRNEDGYSMIKVPTDKTISGYKSAIANIGYVDAKVPDAPDDAGTYVLKCTISGSKKTYKWVKES